VELSWNCTTSDRYSSSTPPSTPALEKKWETIPTTFSSTCLLRTFLLAGPSLERRCAVSFARFAATREAGAWRSPCTSLSFSSRCRPRTRCWRCVAGNNSRRYSRSLPERRASASPIPKTSSTSPTSSGTSSCSWLRPNRPSCVSVRVRRRGVLGVSRCYAS